MLEVPQTLEVDGSFVLVWSMRHIDHGEQSAPRADGSFGGCLTDPIPLELAERGTLQPRGAAPDGRD
jgi:hypothetical protein